MKDHKIYSRSFATTILLSTFFLTGAAHAEYGGGAQRSGGFYFSLAAKGGLANIASEDNEVIEKRDAWSYGGELTLGYRALGLLFGATAEYQFVKQRKDPDDVDGTNASGSILSVAPTVGVPFGMFLFQLRPHFYSTYSLDRKSSGKTLEYNSPELPSFTAQLVYSLGRSYFGIEYTSITYKKYSYDGDESSLDDDAKVNFANLGLVYGFKF